MSRRWGWGTATGSLVSALLVPAYVAHAGGPDDGAARAVSVLDDRALKATGTWKKVKQKKAFKKTLSRGTKKGAALTTKASATNGGTVTFWTGRRNGTATITVGGTVQRTVKTKAKKAKALTVTFSGAGAVRITVKKPGKKGVYVDKVALESGTVPPTPPTPPPTVPSPVALGAVTQVDTSAAGVAANDDVRTNAALSPDGTKLAFWSQATNLVPGVTDGPHLYVKTVAGAGAGSIVVADSTAAGTPGSSGGVAVYWREVSWAPDSNNLIFTSSAANLGCPSGPCLIIKTLSTGAVGMLVDNAQEASFSPDGQWVAFTSSADYLGRGVTSAQVYIYRAATGTELQLLSTSAAGVVGNDAAYLPAWSPDSTRLAFESRANNLVPGDTNNESDVFVKTVVSGAIARASTDASGAQANGGSGDASWSPDGQSLAFNTWASNLYAGDYNTRSDIVTKSLTTGAVAWVSYPVAGIVDSGNDRRPVWSPDGTKIAFETDKWFIADVMSDVNQARDVYVRDLTTGVGQLVSARADGGNGNGSSILEGFGGNRRAWAPDGSALYFVSSSTNLGPVGSTSLEPHLFRKAM